MGWLEEKFQGHVVEISDEGVDLIVDAINAFVRHYEEDTGRRPTLPEFLASLQHVLRASGQVVFSDLEEKQVTGVRATTAKSKKRQSFTDGDYFLVPLARDKLAYGRVLFHRGAGGYLLEFYVTRTELPLTLEQLLAQSLNVAFARHVWAEDSLGKGRWPIIGHRDIPKDYSYPTFYMGVPGVHLQITEGPNRKRPTVADEAAKLEPCMYFSPEDVEERLRLEAYDGWPEIEHEKATKFPGYRPNVHKKLRHVKWPP